MSFLKIADPIEREQTVKEFLAIKKNIRANELAKKTGNIELQTDLSELFKPVTETQKETQKETQRRITEGLRPIRKGLRPIKGIKGIITAIEQLPQRLPQQLPQQIGYPLSTAPPSYRSTSPAPSELSEVPSTSIEEIAFIDPDNIFGPRMTPSGKCMGNKPFEVEIKGKDKFIIIDKNKYRLTKGLSNLIFSKDFDPDSHTPNDYSTYRKILALTGTMHHNNDPTNPNFKFSAFDYPRLNEKAKYIREDIWLDYIKTKQPRGKKGSGIKKVVIPSDPNALLEKLDLLMASKVAGNTGVRNELVSVCDELKRQGVFDSKSYKKNNVRIIKI